MNRHPNASVAGGTGAVGIIVIAALSAVGITLTPIVAAAIVSVATTLILIVGRRGLRGLLDAILNGSGS